MCWLEQIERIQQFDRAPGGTDGAGGEMQIPRRGFQAPVPQQRLNDKQIGTVFEQMSGEGVAQ
jgi:hypothetical protein